MFYYILIFFTVFYHVWLSDLPGNWSVSDLPGELPLAQRLNRHFPALQKELQHFWATEAKATGNKTMGKVKSKVGSVPLFCLLLVVWFFFFPGSFCWCPDGFLGTHFDGRFICESMASMNLGFRRSTWKGLVLIQPVPWLNHAWPSTYCGDGLIIWGGVSKIWEPGCFIETFKITVFDCLIVCLPLLPGFEYYTLTLIDKTTITTVLGSRPTLSEACDLMPVCNFRIEFFKHLISVSLISQKFSSLAKDDVMSHQKQAHNRSTTTSWIESVCLSGPLVSIYTQLPCRAETNL